MTIEYDAKREAERIQTNIFAAMTPDQKFEIIEKLNRDARELKAAYIRQCHPDWTEDKVQRAVREIFLYARS